jgi:hypothetical protein
LERAEESYKTANPLRGELDLHLAQAEIQRACENSREILRAIPQQESFFRREQVPVWMRYYPLGAVASIFILIIWMGTWLAAFSDGGERKARTLVGASIWTSSIQVKVRPVPENRLAVRTVSKEETPTQKASIREKTVEKQGESKPEADSIEENESWTNSYPEPTYYYAQSDEHVSFQETIYDLRDSEDDQWHAASISGWGEERIVRDSVPSFSER